MILTHGSPFLEGKDSLSIGVSRGKPHLESAYDIAANQ